DLTGKDTSLDLGSVRSLQSGPHLLFLRAGGTPSNDGFAVLQGVELVPRSTHQVGVVEDDWPQLARNPQRTAVSPSGVPPPYQGRWIWCGPDKTLRNTAANPAWPDDLASGTNRGVNYPLPERVPFTIAGRAQPVVSGGRVFIGDMDGSVYALA